MWEARNRFSEPGSQRIEEMAEVEIMFCEKDIRATFCG